MGWLSGWTYRKSHVLNPAAGAGTGYQVKVIVHYGSGEDSQSDVYLDGKCMTDFGDIRFTDDEGTELDYWMESKVDSDNAVFWVEVSDNLSTTSVTIYLYYGKDESVTTSDGSNTFPSLYTHFDGDSLPADWVDWYTEYGTQVVANSLLKITGQTGSSGQWKTRAVRTTSLFGSNLCLMFKVDTLIYANRHIPDIGLGDFPELKTPTNRAIWQSIWDNSIQQFVNMKAGASTSSAFTISAGDVVSIARQSDVVNYYTNGTLRISHDTNIPTANLYAYFGIAVGALAAAQAEQVFIEWAAMRSWVYPEPVHGEWGGEETQEITKDLSSNLMVRNSSSKDFPSSFDIRQSGSTNLSIEFIPRRLEENLSCIFEVRKSTSGNLASHFVVRKSSFIPLSMSFIVFNKNEKDLSLEVVVRGESSSDSSLNFIIRKESFSDGIHFSVIVRNEQWLPVPVEAMIRNIGLENLRCFGEIRNASFASLVLFGSIRNASFEELSSKMIVRHSSSLNFPQEFITRNAGTAPFSFEGQIRNEASSDLSFSIEIRNKDFVSLPGIFVLRNRDEIDLNVNSRIRHKSYSNLLCSTLIRHQASLVLNSWTSIRNIDSKDLKSLLRISRETLTKDIGFVSTIRNRPFFIDRENEIPEETQETISW